MNRRAFTLIEMIMAISATAILLVAIYGVFSKAVKMRDNAVARTRAMAVQMRAVDVIRTDLRNAIVTTGVDVLEATKEARSGNFPCYFKFTTTTARKTADEEIATDVQRVEYYVITDTNAVDRNAGVLVRAPQRNLLAPVEEEAIAEPLLTGVQSLETSFYDGTSWVETWRINETETDVPKAVRVTIQRAPEKAGDTAPAPIEILVPWLAARAVEVEEEEP